MTFLDPNACVAGVQPRRDPRSRAVRRPAITTAILIMVALLIVLDVCWRRRRAAAHLSAT